MLNLFTAAKSWAVSISSVVLSLLAIAVILCSGATPAAATGITQIMPLTAGDPTWIVDDADVISRVNEGKINTLLATLAKDTGNEVRIVTIHRFDYGETPETFVNGLFERWFPTPAEQEHQTLLVLDDLTNGVALRTGDGVKPLLSEEIATSVAQETVMVPLRAGNFYNQAFLGAADRLVAVLSGAPDPGPPVVEDTLNVASTFTSAEETDDYSATIIVGIILAVATIVPMVTYYWYIR